MWRRIRIASLVVLALVIIAALSWYSTTSDPFFAELVGSERVELLALDPYSYDPEASTEDTRHFHGWTVFGRTDAESAGARDRIVGLVHRCVRIPPMGVAMCFSPRHGLSITKDGHVTDLVICFECRQMEVYVDGERAMGYSPSDWFAGSVTDFYEARGLKIAPEEK